MKLSCKNQIERFRIMIKTQKWCPDCPKCFSNRTYLVFVGDSKMWCCPQCGVKFASKQLQKEDKKRKRERERMIGRGGG